MLPGFDPTQLRIAIVGSGAVGGYYGARLAQHGRDVHFLMRSDFNQVRQHGLHIKSSAGDFCLTSPKIYRDANAIGPCDLVIIALKATSNAELPQLLKPLVRPDTLLLTLQNGLGNEEFLAQHFPGPRILGGLCFVCINRTAPGVIEHLAAGQIRLGEHGRDPLPRTQEIAADFERCGIPCVVDPSLAAAHWQKLVWNIPFNGLSIAAGCIDTLSILESSPLCEAVRSIMLEVIAAARFQGYELPDSLADSMITNTLTMGRYRPSSLIDFEAGQAVELEAIWGEPLRRAAESGHPMHQVELLYQMLKHAVARRVGE